MKIKTNSNHLTESIIKKRRLRSLLSNILLGRLVLTFFLILLQIIIVFVLVERLSLHIGYYFGGSISLSFFFITYLVNSRGKNEFKIAWLLPVILFPFFGITVYIFYHISSSGHFMRKRLSRLRQTTDAFLPCESETDKIAGAYPDAKGIAFYLSRSGHYPPHENSYVTYFANGESFFPDFIAELEKAEQFIFLEFFIIKIDESWLTILKILEEKARLGVEVRVLFDAIGSVSAAARSYIRHLEELHIQAQIFSPITPIFSIHYNNRDHRKIVVIDGKTAYTGGINIANEYFNSRAGKFNYWKDSAVKIKGPAIKNLTTLFMHTWNLRKIRDSDMKMYIEAEYEHFLCRGLLIPYGDNAFNDEDIAENVYSYMINSAKQFIHITTPYLVIDNQLSNDLIFAAKRGVEVSLILPSKPDHFITFCIGKTFMKELVDNGVHIYLYKKDCFIHAKNFIVDGRTATIGSVNLDYRSLFHHFECGVLMHEADAIADIERDFQQTAGESTELSGDFYKKLPLHIKIFGKIFRIFAPLV